MKKIVMMILILYASFGVEIVQKEKVAFAVDSDVGISFNENYTPEVVQSISGNIPNGTEINTSNRMYPQTGVKQTNFYFMVGMALLVLATLIKLSKLSLTKKVYIKKRKEEGDSIYEY